MTTPAAGDAGCITPPTLRQLVQFINVMTEDSTHADDVLKDLIYTGADTLTDYQKRMFHSLAESYAGDALVFASIHPGGRDQSTTTSPALVFAHAVLNAERQLTAELGVPEHRPDGGHFAAARAAVLVLAWAEIVFGHTEAQQLFRRALDYIRRPG
ncbi:MULTISPECIES: hypothetical protein [unclassified Amycolatopsis]|uniref:hypothetical protein n=1 Tax=unclassified Amycolatopsis TaxID=2618356 RepID=UPI0028743825|nr:MULTISPECIES: hypothetical protein [unclassified Amycolatopsis]MDS0140617.1 hypothetical protein [Amycolatopsis sp. 505]MDS0149267.1 hypothetical protein [Amycolatopsis sp. CM201R]